jgi:hypothetical protein
LKEIYGISNDEDTTDEIDKLRSFIPYFINALQVDDEKELSEEELTNFKVILKCSVVTSVNATTEDPNSDSKDWDYRNKNKDLVKETAEKLKKIGNFTAWMPRKARPGVKFSDISGWYTWTTKAGFDCSLEYYLSRISEFIIGVNIHVTLSNGKGSEQIFFEVLGNNPLKLSMAPQKEEWGRYVYSNVLRLNANDSSAADQIASITNNAYASINETIESYQKMQSENK